MIIKFCGAARGVTGSQHLISINGSKLLLDCGMFQGKREESFKMNRKFLYQPSDVNAVVLSHSHIDHAGNLPTLMAKGFNGSIYCTSAARDLCSIMLQDSAYIQEKDVEFVNKKRAKKGEPLFNPLYTVPQSVEVMKQFKSFPYKKTFALDNFENKVRVTFCDAGHILGSAQVVLEISENGKTTKIGFTGDLGRYNLPILKDPEFMGDVDYLIIESTYGGKFHSDANLISSELTSVITKALKTNAKIIVPSFSIGRTQELVYELSKLTSKGIIPEFPIFVDSPLTVSATEIFKLHPECFDIETTKLLASGVNVFGLDNVLYIKDVEDSKKLNSVPGPCMIISASGMCEAGRILHHLANNIGNPNNMVLIIGFMAVNTLGRRLIESKDERNATVKIFGEEYKVRAKIEILDSFSAHADHNDIINYIKLFDRNRLKKIFLVHGEFEKQKILLEDLLSKGYKNIVIPDRGEEYNLN
jgi:metallo-beta-lactamase family protein